MADLESATASDSQTFGGQPAQSASFPPVQQAESGGPPKNIDFILDIPMSVTVYVGSTKMAIRDLLQLAQGSVIELDKLAGEPMDVMVNNKLVARGEVVVVNEKFGIRLTDVVSAAERVQQLR
ncbi:MAG: flagellar motor switch protein FliN [Nitrospira sp. HN-bin3]|jgi:flagellar motor switch protein FliN/FliY|uniref:flagellar motor switch protein FliN n=1 Tax=Nitrospira cf. moscoviensis SBR1015 TaxID=96242 RepID=UPI000A0DFF9F|nr:flagellar motor switch protein FliN [Nitrospira cf. moscoviensis SBR1015]MBH0208445.1 flagellar motor switch protein FliN [Nitrospira sp.]OQW45504.1 MAG: flagellar motor switch protein FliN [Nitrospira sp. HN-bin3]